MSQHAEGWAQLKHGGLLISPAKLEEFFPDSAPAMSDFQAEQLRRALTAFDGSSESLGSLLDYILQDLSGLPAEEWQKAQAVDSRWAVRSFTGTLVKPRRLWVGPNSETLALFAPDDSGSRQFSGRLGVGRSRQLLGRVVEWLRRTQQSLALVTNGRQWRLIHAGADYDAWCEWDIDLWFSEGQPAPQTYIWRTLLNRRTLLAEHEQSLLLQAISASRKGQTELSNVLGERVRQAVEELITASHVVIEQAKQQGHIHDYKDLYVAGSRIIMRCIITLFAEARGLMPVDNPIYQQAYSLEGLRHQLDRRAGGRGNERLSQGRSAWPRLISLFNLIYEGSAHERLTVPQYGGALFEPGNPDSADGVSRALALLESSQNMVSDLQVHKLLRLLTRTKMKVRQGRSNRRVDAPVDFSTLSSEYIGILYEGLLDFELRQAAHNDPVIFLAVGNQPALTLSQLEAMDDKAIKQLFEALKKKDKAGDDSGDGGAEDGESAESEDIEDIPDDEAETDEDASEGEAEASNDDSDELILSEDHLQRANAWLQRAALLAGLAKKPRGRKVNTTGEEPQQELEKAARQLCARMVAPGQFYLVRWGGTRKGAGTFYTRPQLAAPTVRRTLQPLAYDPVRMEKDPRTGLDTVVEWVPKKPEQILALKVCDPAMGSGSFLASALRFLTEALTQSLFHHKLIERSEDGGVPRMADGRLAELLSDELTKLNPSDEGFEEALRAQLKRHIVENCLYGVDLDPLAVELGRMALWVETMDRDLPFGFLDHKLKVGNALVGAWFDTYRDYPAMAWEREGGDKDYQKNKSDNLINHWYKDASGKRKGDVFTDAIKARAKAVPEQLRAMLSGQLMLGSELEAANVHDELLKVFRKLHRLPVHESEKRAELYRQEVLNNPHYHALKARMDLWCALWFWPGDKIELAPLPQEFANPGEQAMAIAAEVARRQRFFHWELEFPDVFTAEREGFDALLGNPPWEIQKPNSKEFFSNHDPLYRAYGKQDALAKQLEYFRAWPQLEHDWIAYNANLKSMSNWAKYVGKPFGDRVLEDKSGNKKHDLNLGGRGKNSFEASAALHKKWAQQRKKHKGLADTAHPFLHQGSADLNTYKMFLELSHALLRKQGRLGMIVPSGIYTDKGTTDLRELFLSQCDWQWLFGFENREEIFDIHRSFKFCPLIVQKGGETTVIRAAFMHRNVDDWEQAERYVLAYPRARVEEFSPYSKAILEIRSEQDLRVLQKIYANGVLLGDQSEKGWGIKYAREFDMTNDSKLFPPRPKWEEKGYRPDEYGHWLKGPWREYRGPQHILEREPGLVLSRDGRSALHVEEIEDVALPIYNAKIFDLWDYCVAGWVSGKGRGAKWESIDFPKVMKPEYLMGLGDWTDAGAVHRTSRLLFKDISTAVHKRTMRSAITPNFPAVNASPVLSCEIFNGELELQAVLGSFEFDYIAKFKIGYLHLNYFILEECALAAPTVIRALQRHIKRISARLSCCSEVFSSAWIDAGHSDTATSWRKQWAVTEHERLRLRVIIDALMAYSYGLEVDEFSWILRDTDYPLEFLRVKENTKSLDQKRFWRIDKDKDPELRHTVLSLVAFHDLKEKGLEAFLAQNDGEGWMIPEQLRLADYGLGHDDRAREYQPVASRLGPRFYDWQLNEDIERSWEECAAHAELIRRIVPLPATDQADADTKNKSESSQGELF